MDLIIQKVRTVEQAQQNLVWVNPNTKLNSILIDGIRYQCGYDDTILVNHIGINTTTRTNHNLALGTSIST